MRIKTYFIIFSFWMLFFFFGLNIKVDAKEIYILSYPSASDLTYGEPLFESKLTGGKASVEGHFKWKEANKSLMEIGTSNEDVLFIPEDSSLDILIMKIEVKVNKRRVYIKFEDNLYKQYDGNVGLDLPNYVIGGIIDSSVYVAGDLKGTTASVLVGDNIGVNLEGLELKGEKKDNYYLDLKGFYATIHPKVIEKFGGIKNRVEFSENVYVPVDSLVFVDEINSNGLSKSGFEIKSIYDLYIKSSYSRIEVSGDVGVRVKIEQADLDYRRIKIYNYYNDEFQQLDYKYIDGYLYYNCSGLGKLVIAQEDYNYSWVYISLVFVLIGGGGILLRKYLNDRKSINRYKSLKRRKDNEDC